MRVDQMESIHQTLEQVRAHAAWKLVSEAQNKKDFDKYTSLVKGFPATIVNNGLGQAVAFLYSKAKDGGHEALLLSHLERWLTKSDLNRGVGFYPCPYEEEYSPKVLLNSIQKHDSSRYRRATIEALAFLNYLRRFAVGLAKTSIKYGSEQKKGEED